MQYNDHQVRGTQRQEVCLQMYVQAGARKEEPRLAEGVPGRCRSRDRKPDSQESFDRFDGIHPERRWLQGQGLRQCDGRGQGLQ